MPGHLGWGLCFDAGSVGGIGEQLEGFGGGWHASDAHCVDGHVELFQGCDEGEVGEAAGATLGEAVVFCAGVTVGRAIADQVEESGRSGAPGEAIEGGLDSVPDGLGSVPTARSGQGSQGGLQIVGVLALAALRHPGPLLRWMIAVSCQEEAGIDVTEGDDGIGGRLGLASGFFDVGTHAGGGINHEGHIGPGDGVCVQGCRRALFGLLDFSENPGADSYHGGNFFVVHGGSLVNESSFHGRVGLL